MIPVKALFKTGLSKVTGLNWYKWGAVLALLLAWTTAVHMRATNECEQRHLKDQKEQAEKKSAEIVEHVQERIPVVQERDSEAAKLRAQLADIKEDLDDAINARGPDPSCDLTDAELDGFRQLSEKTRTSE